MDDSLPILRTPEDTIPEDTYPNLTETDSNSDEFPFFENDPEESSSKRYHGDDDDDGTICPICLEAWTNSGAHRICSLKCGHLFGHKCVLRWLDSQSKKTCPTCKMPVKRLDIRFIYAKKLIAIDNIELEKLRLQLEGVEMEKNMALQNVSKYVSREHVLQQEIEHLKRRIQDLTIGSKSTESSNHYTLQHSLPRIRLYLEKNIEVCNKGGCRDCRGFDVSVRHDLLFITARSPTDLFGGFGLKKLSLTTFKPVKFIPLHKDSIRDMCFHPTESKVLTVSNDKKFRITDAHTTMTIFTCSLDSAPWACGWSPRYSEELFIGTQNGTVSIFDVRNLHAPKMKLKMDVPGDFSPVVSLAGLKDESDSDILLVAKLNSLWAFQIHADGTYSRHLLPVEGPFLSLKYEQDTKQILVSSRPNNQTPYSRHSVCYLQKQHDPDVITSNIVHTFRSGNTAKLLAKTSCFVPNNIVAGHHESRKSILLYSINTGEEIGSCPTHENSVLDIKSFSIPNGKFLTYLNEKKLEVFKFNTF
ncbi:E3 ubiquitin-protein ligase RFWD3-like [Sitophilus oryzae]|uniref:RING-type E3 ubiquitin transferase n=1 Tax=Sitophilus oryzae TaxID=7048 RepID=A0A6J2X4G3_SITOR|nr:E3 ubiquitin-protein ligase RFWD3-like [Sitophilus oryzae]XP_030745835.1 E3 ubiquitin-protein ligase RFWD3-like [Sitophilus oryzae]